MPIAIVRGLILVGSLFGLGYVAKEGGEAVESTSKAALYFALAFGVYLFLTNNKGKLF